MDEKSRKKELPRLQRLAAEFVEDHDREVPVQARVLDLDSEVGEVSKEVLEGTGYGDRPFEASEGWAEELGDVLFALACLANSTNVELEAALAGALEKYRGRFATGGDLGSGRR